MKGDPFDKWKRTMMVSKHAVRMYKRAMAMALPCGNEGTEDCPKRKSQFGCDVN